MSNWLIVKFGTVYNITFFVHSNNIIMTVEDFDDKAPEEISLSGAKESAMVQRKAIQAVSLGERTRRREVDTRLKDLAAQRRLANQPQGSTLEEKVEHGIAAAATENQPKKKKLLRNIRNETTEVVLAPGKKVVTMTEGWKQKTVVSAVDRVKASKEALLALRSSTKRVTASRGQAYSRLGLPAAKFYDEQEEVKTLSMRQRRLGKERKLPTTQKTNSYENDSE